MSTIPQAHPIVKWERHKMQSEKLAKRMLRMGSISRQRVSRMLSCGEQINYQYCPTCGKHHVTGIKLCRDRMCPLCSWRLSIQRYHEMVAVLEEMKPEMERMQSKVCMLTLTVRNVNVEDLRSCMLSMTKAWNSLRGSKQFKRVMGWARCAEITYNIRTRTVHPHFHILLVYDSPNVDIASTMGELKAGWKSAASLDYNPIIDLCEAYSNNGNDDIIAAAGEAFAYSIKPATSLLMPDKPLEEFIRQIQGLRFVSYGKRIKELRAKLGYQDELEEEKHEQDICECGTRLEKVALVWAAGGYKNLEEVGAIA